MNVCNFRYAITHRGGDSSVRKYIFYLDYISQKIRFYTLLEYLQSLPTSYVCQGPESF